MRPWIRGVPLAEWHLVQHDHDPGELPRPWETVHGSQVAPCFAGISTAHMQRSLSALQGWTRTQAATIQERFKATVFIAAAATYCSHPWLLRAVCCYEDRRFEPLLDGSRLGECPALQRRQAPLHVGRADPGEAWRNLGAVIGLPRSWELARIVVVLDEMPRCQRGAADPRSQPILNVAFVVLVVLVGTSRY